MRKKNSFFVLLVATVLLASSCKKRRFPLPLEFCNISEVTVAQNGSPDTSVYHLTYDREGRLTGMQSSGGIGSGTKTYQYADTNLVVNTIAGGSTTTDSVTLNNQGLMLVDVTRSSSSNYLLTTYYFYTGTEVTSAYLCEGCETPPGPGPSTWEYTWNNGNLDVFIPQANITTTTSTSYSYNSSPAAVGDYFSIMQLLSSPAPTVVTTNQVDEFFQNYGTSTVTYSQNANGRILGMTIITSGPAMFGYGAPDTVNYSYKYECEISSPLLEKN